MEQFGLLGGAFSPHEGTQRKRGVGDPRVALLAWQCVGAEGGESRRRGTSALSQFKQIFSNNKRKVLFEVSGRVKFEGEELELKL